MRAACVAKAAALGAELEQSMLQLLDLRAAAGAEQQEHWQQLSDKTAAAEARAKEMENELAVANDSVSELQTSLQQQILRQRALQQTLQLSDDEKEWDALFEILDKDNDKTLDEEEFVVSLKS